MHSPAGNYPNQVEQKTKALIEDQHVRARARGWEPAAIAAPGFAILARCRMCGSHRNPHEFVGGGPITGYCWQCLEWNRHAMDVLAGAPPRGCQECGRTHDQMERLGGTADVKYRLHPKDGIYQILGVACGCSDEYERKRLDMYGRTPDGERKKLMGAK